MTESHIKPLEKEGIGRLKTRALYLPLEHGNN